MSKYISLIMLSCAIALCSRSLYGQESVSRTMDIDEIFSLAETNSTSLKCFEINSEAAMQAVKAAEGERLPEISAQLSACYWGNVYLTDRDYTNGQWQSMPHFGNNFVLKVNQVVYSGGAITSSINLAKINSELAMLDQQQNKKRIKFLLVGYYLQLSQLNNQLQVLDQNINLTRKMIELMSARRESGTIIKNDITRYELQLESLTLQRIKIIDAKNIVSHNLATVIGLPLNSEIVPHSTLSHENIPLSSEEQWQSLATGKSTELQRAALNIKLHSEQLKLAKSARLPKISVFAEDHLDGPIVVEVPVIDKNLNYWYVGVGISYNLSSIYKDNKKIKQAQISSRLAQENLNLARESVENGIHAAFVKLQTSYSELKTRIKSVDLANQNYSVVNNRYINDLALITDMIDAANSKLNAELDLENAKIDIIYNYYNMLYIINSL